MKSLFLLMTLMTALSAWAHVVPGITDARVITHEGNKVELLTNIKGFTLYTFDPDGEDESTCYEACAKVWPPILLNAADVKKVKAPFTVAERNDGTLQLNFDGRPLYLFANDKKPGDTLGDGLGGVWHIAIDQD